GEVREGLLDPDTPQHRLLQLQESLCRASHVTAIQSFVAEMLEHRGTPLATRIMLMDVMATAPVGEFPAKWVATIKRCLNSLNSDITHQAIKVVRARNLSACREALEAILADPAQNGEVHIAALATLAPWVFWLTPDQFQFLLKQLKDDSPLT